MQSFCDILPWQCLWRIEIMLNVLSFFVDSAYVVFGVRIALAALMVICSVFIIVVVLIQSSNSDGMEAMTGARSDNDSYYGKNASQRKEHVLKVLTYIAAGVMAAVAITFLVLSAII